MQATIITEQIYINSQYLKMVMFIFKAFGNLLSYFYGLLKEKFCTQENGNSMQLLRNYEFLL